jgi:hypothetical protein
MPTLEVNQVSYGKYLTSQKNIVGDKHSSLFCLFECNDLYYSSEIRYHCCKKIFIITDDEQNKLERLSL